MKPLIVVLGSVSARMFVCVLFLRTSFRVIRGTCDVRESRDRKVILV